MQKSIFSFILLLSFLSLTASCSDEESYSNSKSSSAEKTTLKVCSWNLQTFFDAETKGTEYTEFVKSNGKWTRESYLKRLDRLCKSLKELDPDVFVMEEIENEGILFDIFNRMEGLVRQGKNYTYGCFATGGNSSIGCAVLSRYPLSNLTVHGIEQKSEQEEMPSMRPAMLVTVQKNGKKLNLAVLHWKSKSNGEEQSKKWRLWQESVLARLFLQTQGAILACGDFNQDINEFSDYVSDSQENTFLRRFSNPVQKVSVFSPWKNSDGNLVQPGSYYFDSEWERIDHFFSGSHQSIRHTHRYCYVVY